MIALLEKTMFMISLLFLREYGPPSSFQVYLINLVFFFFEHVFILLQVFLFLYLHLDLSLWHGLRLFFFLLLLLSPPPLSSSSSLLPPPPCGGEHDVSRHVAVAGCPRVFPGRLLQVLHTRAEPPTLPHT